MTTELDEALAYLREARNPAEPAYLVACNTLAANLEALPYRVFIRLPGGLAGNTDSAWDAVRAVSRELCGCGNERMFDQHGLRSEFEPSTAEPIIMKLGDQRDFVPLGAPASSAYLRLWVMERADGLALAYQLDPALFRSENLFFTHAYDFSRLKRAVDGPVPAVFSLENSAGTTPVCLASAVDLTAGTITITLDAAVEALSLDAKSESSAEAGETSSH